MFTHHEKSFHAVGSTDFSLQFKSPLAYSPPYSQNHWKVIYAGHNTSVDTYQISKHVREENGYWREIRYPLVFLRSIMRVFQNSTEGTTFIITQNDVQLYKPNARDTEVIFSEPDVFIDDGAIDWASGKIFLATYFSSDSTTGLVVIDLLGKESNNKKPWGHFRQFTSRVDEMAGFYTTLALGTLFNRNAVYFTWKNNIGVLTYDLGEFKSQYCSAPVQWSLSNLLFNRNTEKVYFIMKKINSNTDEITTQIGICKDEELIYDEMEILNRRLTFGYASSLDLKGDVLYVIEKPARSNANQESVGSAINVNNLMLLDTWDVSPALSNAITVVEPAEQEFDNRRSCMTEDKCTNGICLDTPLPGYPSLTSCTCFNGFFKNEDSDLVCEKPVPETFDDKVRPEM